MLRLWHRLSRENKVAAVLIATSAGVGLASLNPAGWRRIMSWQAHGTVIQIEQISRFIKQGCKLLGAAYEEHFYTILF